MNRILFALFLTIIFLTTVALTFSCSSDSSDTDSGDDDDDTSSDDDDDNNNDDDNDNGPDAEVVALSGCLAQKSDPWPQSLEFSYEAGVLTVIHRNAVFNCCYDSISVTMTTEGQTVNLYETDYTPEPCNCICPVDVTMEVQGLTAGQTYDVNCYTNGTLAISGQVVIP